MRGCFLPLSSLNVKVWQKYKRFRGVLEDLTQDLSKSGTIFQMENIEFAHYLSIRPSYKMMKNGGKLFCIRHFIV